jgi:uncharacterized membrane protein
MTKSAAFGVLHLVIAFTVSYALTGSYTIAGAITIVEPIVNTVAHYFFDGWWERRQQRKAARENIRSRRRAGFAARLATRTAC